MSKLEQRIEDLEMRISFQEDTIEALNTALADQQTQLLLMQKQIKLLADKLTTMQPEAVVPLSQEPPPPHY